MSVKTSLFAFFIWVVLSSAQDVSTLKIIFAGDLMGHITQVKAANREANGKGYDYKPVYKHLKPYFSSADIAIVNLEHTLAGEPYSGFPQFSSPDESIFAIKDAGFNLITTANNHSLDRGKQGLERTISVLDSIGLRHLGTYRNSTEKKNTYPLFFEKNGFVIAFLNYTYGTNLLVEEAPNVVNRMNRTQIAADIKKAKLASPDFIIAIMHWGLEYETVQSAEQKKLAKFMAENGVNVILGSHPHVVQPFEKIFVKGSDSVHVIYSVGNFISNQRKRYTDGGVIFEFTLQKSDRARVSDYGYMPLWVYKFSEGDGNVYRMLPECKTNASICKKYKMSAEDKAAMELFFKDTRKILWNLPVIIPVTSQ